MANSAAIIANRGYFYTPHVVREILDTTIDNSFKQKHVTSIKPEVFEPIIEGMYRVVQGEYGATARHIAIPELPYVEKQEQHKIPWKRSLNIYGICST
jgi:penicillin-binding protein 2